VTAFPTEYRYREEHQEAQFMIKAECFNDDEMRFHIQELLDAYRTPYLPSASELTQAEFEVAEDKSVAAKQVFESAFAIPETDDGSGKYPRLDLETMKEKSEAVYDEILQQLCKVGLALQWPTEMENGFWRAEASTANDVNQQLRPFINRGLWVFVKIAR
jgi:hypothetical protein